MTNLNRPCLRAGEVNYLLFLGNPLYKLKCGGTSLVVYPAAGLVNYYRGNKLVLINKSATSMDSYADLVISEKIGEVFAEV